MDLTDIYRTSHPKPAGYTSFSSAHRTFSKTNHAPGLKTSLNKFKKTETTSNIFPDHKNLRLEINHKKELQKPQTHKS